MPERTVKVNLVASVNGYVAGMEAAARKTAALGTEAEKLAQKRQAFEDLGRPLLAFGAIAAAAVGIAIKKFADFDQAMSNVQAVTQATTSDMVLLKDAALDAGGRTVFTATEAANALEELGKASFDTATSIDALDGTLSLAASSQLDVARAAEITATTLKQYNLEGLKAGHVADVLSAGAGKALGSVDDLAEGLKYVGPVAHSMGISLEETVGALALFADQGLIGEQAGTSLRGVLSSITSPSKEAADEIERLGISLYDTEGSFLGLENVAGQLDKGLSGLTDQQRDLSLGIIFGNQQVTAARVLFAGGAASIHRYTAEVNEAGYAAKVSAARMDNLKGDVEKLGGSFDSFLIKSGSGANDVLRGITQSLTFLVDMAGQIPQPMLNAGLAVGVVAGAVALTGGAALIAVPRVVAFKTALVTTGIGAKGAALAIAGVGGAIGVATVLIGYFVQAQAASSAAADEFANSLDKTTGAATDYTRELVAKRLAESGAYDSAKNLGISQQELTDAVLEGGDALDEINAKLTAQNNIVDFFNGSGIAAGNAQATIRDLTGELKTGKERFENYEAATESSATTMDRFSGKVSTADDSLKNLRDTIEAFGAGQLDLNAAERAFEASVDDAAAAIKENGKTLDVNTAQGRANQDSIDEIATATFKLSGALLDQGASQEQVTQAMKDGRAEYINAAIAAGQTREEAERLADGLGLIPQNIPIAVKLLGATGVKNDLTRIYGLIQAVGRRDAGTFTISGGVGGYATGGYTPAVPTLAMVSEKGTEFVSTAATLSDPANRQALEYMHAGGSMANYSGAASSVSGSGITINVPVTVSAGVITNEGSVAREVTRLVQTALRNGDIPEDWNSR